MLTSMAGAPRVCGSEADSQLSGSIVGPKPYRRTYLPGTPDEPSGLFISDADRQPPSTAQAVFIMIRVSTNKEHAMTGTIQIDPQTIFTDGGLRLLLGLPSATLARARREGRLRYARRGKQIFYTGAWVVDWLVGEPAKAFITSDSKKTRGACSGRPTLADTK
jgi:hypothetical protein